MGYYDWDSDMDVEMADTVSAAAMRTQPIISTVRNDMSNDSIIAAKVDEFVAREQAFTSVDVCNSIKVDGTWIRNREVAAWLRRWTPSLGYCVSRVTVTLDGGNQTQAQVYLPVTTSVADYAETSQRAMTPAEFEALHGVDPTQPQRDDGVLATVVDVDDDGSDGGDGSMSGSVGDLLRAAFKWPKSKS